DAKQRYFTETSAFSAYDEKALMQVTLYGLPQYRLISGGVLSDDDPFPSVNITTTASLDDGDVTTRNVTFNLTGSFDALEPNSLADGDYFDIDGGAQVTADQPMQPEFFANVTSATAGQIHGVLVREGRYTDVDAVDPLVSQPVHEWVPREDWAEPPQASEGWWPPRPASVQSLNTGDVSVDRLVSQLGQFNADTGQQRLYDSMDIDLLYSESEDWQGPEISLVTESVDWAQYPAQASIKVEASDVSGVLSGLATYTDGGGQWRSADLVYDAGRMKWTVTIPATSNTIYFIQMIDNAGNVSTADNKGHYYRLADSMSQVYLPTLLKR
ncbi:MAG: hypothetical protein J5I90_15950, partial [Caldilineales bacterium]|nr:hypothetical protein [Caldilineales bacterium]